MHIYTDIPSPAPLHPLSGEQKEKFHSFLMVGLNLFKGTSGRELGSDVQLHPRSFSYNNTSRVLQPEFQEDP